jgi:hypothetical protein
LPHSFLFSPESAAPLACVCSALFFFFFGMAAATHTTAPGGLESYRQYEAKIYMKDPSSVERHSVLFTVKNRVGALDDCLRTFRKFNLSLTKIESRPSRVCHVFYCHMFPVAVRSEAHVAELQLSFLSILTEIFSFY